MDSERSVRDTKLVKSRFIEDDSNKTESVEDENEGDQGENGGFGEE